MIRFVFRFATIIFVIAADVGPASAHHSGSNYDFDSLVTLEGTVRDFQWTNPHTIIWIEVDTESGRASELWAIQMTSPGRLRRSGWSHRTLRPGDRISAVVAPMRDGTLAAGLSHVTILETGERLYHFGPPASQEE